ncbi:Protein of unknown function [Bacillus cytotoxicus]|nr:Protein of unknown function [Bacillus cytotoxicus]
MAPAQLEKE